MLSDNLNDFNLYFSALKKVTAVYKDGYYCDGNITFTKMNGIICVNADVTSVRNIEFGTTHTIGYVPDGFCPRKNIYTPLIVYSFYRGIICITNDGDINLVLSEKQIDADSYIRFSCSYGQ